MDELKSLLIAQNQGIVALKKERLNILSTLSTVDKVKRNMQVLKFNRRFIDLNLNFKTERVLLKNSQIEEFWLLESNKKDLIITD